MFDITYLYFFHNTGKQSKNEQDANTKSSKKSPLKTPLMIYSIHDKQECVLFRVGNLYHLHDIRNFSNDSGWGDPWGLTHFFYLMSFIK